jgi:signal transduction histidine kinase
VSFRARLLLVSLAALAAGLGLVLIAGNALLAVGVRSDASSLLQARADTQLAALTVAGDRVTVEGAANDDTLDRQSWVLAGGRVIERPANVAPALDAAAVALGREGRTAERDGPGDVRLRAEPVLAPGGARVGAVVVGLSVEPLERVQVEVLIGSLAVAALVLLAGGLAIRRAVDGALRPVAEMTASAEDWGAHDLDRRFGLGAPRDELTGLAATLDGLLARIAASRRHEQRFTSEMAHELRTPIAGLRARAELALGGSDAERDDALRAVIAQAERLDGAIDALLAVARQELSPGGAVDLAALAREVDDADVSAPPDLPAAEGEPEVVRRALAPLVDNARRRGAVRLELSAGDGLVRIAVRDDGPGLDPALGERAFDPGVRGPDAGGDGAGLGLPLARRLARSCGGDVVAGPGPGGCFVLELPAVRAAA